MDHVLLNKMNHFKWLRLSRGGKQKNKQLLDQLAAWNGNLMAPDQVTGSLGLSPADLAFLDDLGHRVDGWQYFIFSDTPKPWNQDLLANLGLIRLAWPFRHVCLTDAGRFLLTLTRGTA